MRINLENIYDAHIQRRSELNSLKRYVGKEHFYGASASGSCCRKLYYACVEQLEKSNRPTLQGARTMRIGTVVHNDIEYAMKSLTTIEELEYQIDEVITEREIILEDLNVRGFFDLVLKLTDGSVHLYDFKTINGFGYSKRFGHKKNRQPSNGRYEMQLGVYALGVKQMLGRIDSMALVFINKDKSQWKEDVIPLTWMNRAKDWWTQTRKWHKEGLPDFVEDISPASSWECSYCDFIDICKPPKNFKILK